MDANILHTLVGIDSFFKVFQNFSSDGPAFLLSFPWINSIINIHIHITLNTHVHNTDRQTDRQTDREALTSPSLSSVLPVGTWQHDALH